MDIFNDFTIGTPIVHYCSDHITDVNNMISDTDILVGDLGAPMTAYWNMRLLFNGREQMTFYF
jgi:hypothetical protein